MPKIYLDHAAATPLDDKVLEAMQPYFAEKFYNPSATYMAAKAVAKDIADARARVAYWLGARPAEVIFTAGATEANNLAIFGVAQNYPGTEIVSTAIEHESVLKSLEKLVSTKHKIRLVKPDKQGLIKPDVVAKAITSKTVLVSVIYANNEIGTIQPLRRIASAIEAERKSRQSKGNDLPIYLHTDAAQAGNYMDLHVARLGVDMMSLNGGKIYGPKQSGVLYVSAKTKISPIIFGGGQERGLRSGTENVAGIIGLAKALDIAQQTRASESSRLNELQSHFYKELSTHLPKAVINGSLKQRLPNNMHVTFPGIDNERLIIQLDEAGVMAAVGSACSASDDEPSHVLNAIGLSKAEARSSLRFTMGRTTSKQDIDKLLELLTKFVA